MPQPLDKVLPGPANVQLDSPDDPVFNRCPDVALLALSSIASWSKVEAAFLRLFSTVMDGSESVSSAIYIALENQSAKNAAIAAAARVALEQLPDERRVLQALLKYSRTQQKFRDKLAHWVWGHTHRLPDALVLIDPRRSFGRLDKKDMMVFREVDFTPYIQANERLCVACSFLTFVISVTEKTAKRQSMLRRLVESPDLVPYLPKEGEALA